MGWRGWFFGCERSSAALAFLDLFARHALLKSLADLGRVLNPAGGRQAEPFVSLNRILGDAFAFLVTDAEIVLREGVTVLGCLSIPFDSRGKVLPHSVPRQVELRKTVLSPSISLFCGTVIPLGGFSRAALHALAHLVQFSQGGLRGGVSLVSRLAIPLGRLSVTLLYSLAIRVAVPQSFPGLSIPSVCFRFDGFYIDDFDDGRRRGAWPPRLQPDGHGEANQNEQAHGTDDSKGLLP